MKNFKHKEIFEKVCNKFNLKTYDMGNFTHFVCNSQETEIGYVEKISNPRYLYTFLISFFNFEDTSVNDKIVYFISNLYQKQKKVIDQNRQGYNICLELRAKTINQAIII